jgi:CheY-like chemotaxis protein
MNPANPLHRILLVDDEVKVLSALGRSLDQEPYQIIATTSADEAIHLLAGQEFSVIVTD